MDVVSPSACLSHAWPINRERKHIWSWNLAGRKLMTRVAHDPFRGRKVRGQFHQAHWHRDPKISHIFWIGGPANFRFGLPIEYNEPHHRHARWPPVWKLWLTVQVTTCSRRGHSVSAPTTGRTAFYTCESLIGTAMQITTKTMQWRIL